MISLNDVLLAMSNIPVDDPIAEIWGRQMQGGYKIIEYTGSLPITINANGDALIDYRIYGTDGGVGEPTENLIDASKSDINQRVELEPNTDYCLCKYTGPGQGGTPNCYVYDENDNRLFGDYINVWVSYSFTNPSNGAYAIIFFRSVAEGKVSFTKGRATNNNTLYPANYIPYGYKLPMTVSDGNTVQTTPVYIGENQLDAIGEYRDYVDKASGKIVHKIVKIEFDGSEEWKAASGQGKFYITVENGINSVWGTTSGFSKCSHYTPTMSSYNVGEYSLGGLLNAPFTRWNQNIVFNTGISSVNEFKLYLHSQYEDGTPVIVWYVVEIPVEGDPPAPLPEIPTIKGETVIDYDGEPKPSQMYVKYKGEG